MMTTATMDMDNSNISKYKIDYSKWDKFEDTDDDDEDDANRHQKQHIPHVTVLDQPTRVTFGGSNNSSSGDDQLFHQKEEADQPIHMQNNLTICDKTSPESTATSDDGNLTKVTTPCSSSDSNHDHLIPLSWTENGAVIFERSPDIPGDCDGKNNGNISSVDDGVQLPHQTTKQRHEYKGTMYHYFWCQDRLCVHIRIPLYPNSNDNCDSTTSTKIMKLQYNVIVSNMLPYQNRHCAILTNEGEKQQILVTAGTTTSKVVLLNGSLSYPVYIPEDYDDNEVDWSIQEYSKNSITTDTTAIVQQLQQPSFSKYILITLYKATPMVNMTIWWKKLLISEVQEVQRVVDDEERSSSIAFQKAWNDAHQQFKESLQNREKYTL